MKFALLACLLVSQIHAADVVQLTVKETAGLARTDEDVTMGVPLPQNAGYTDITHFMLKNAAGATIPCGIRSLAKWNKDTTGHRWIQLNFPYSIAANDSQKVTLTYEAVPYSLSSKLTAVDNGTTITVNTGKIRFVVKKPNFNLIDQAWVDESGAESYTAANQIISSHSRGFLYIKQNTEYSAANDAASTAVIERNTPGQVCIKASGNLKNSGGSASLYFIVRIYAFNNSPTVRMQSVVEYRASSIDQKDSLQGVHLEIPMTLGATRNAVVSKPGGFEQAALSGSQELYGLTKRPTSNPATYATMGTAIEGQVGGAVTATWNPIPSRPKDVGWAALSDGARGCLVALRWFWQMVPTSVETYADGKMIVGLVSRRANNVPCMFYTGTARSWETQWTFFNTKTTADMRSNAAGMTNRLFAAAPPAWYTRQTLAVLPMVERNQSLYTPAVWTQVNTWENRLNTTWNNILNWDLAQHFTLDQYGFLEWGDNTHYDGISWISEYPWRILWNGNYYGMDFTAYEQFYHTGDLRYLEYGIAHSHHVQDVHLCHFGPGHSDHGASRYCPPAYHINVDDPPTVLTNRSSNPSHHKTEALWQDYYMTGNDYALEVALQGAQWFNAAGTSYATAGELNQYVRRWAHQMFTLECAYLHTRSNVYLNNIIANWEAMKNIIRNNTTIGSDFMLGLGMEAIMKLVPILGPTYGANKPDSVAHFLRLWCDRIYTKPRLGQGVNANVTIAYAYLSKVYGSPYLDSCYVFGNLLPTSYSNLHKDFPQQGRNMLQAMYYLAIPESLKTPVAVEKDSRALPAAAGLHLNVSPTPFSAGTQISLSGSRVWKNTPFEVTIFSPAGALVKTWTGIAAGREHAVEWDALGLAAGVYVVKCRAAGLESARRVTLLK